MSQYEVIVPCAIYSETKTRDYREWIAKARNKFEDRYVDRRGKTRNKSGDDDDDDDDNDDDVNNDNDDNGEKGHETCFYPMSLV